MDNISVMVATRDMVIKNNSHQRFCHKPFALAGR